MKYYWKKQPLNFPKSCGQLAVSIILHKSLKETIKLFGHKKCTKTKDLVKILRSQGINCSDRLKRQKRPNLGIGKLSYIRRKNKKYFHWVVVWKDKIFDGVWGKKDGTVNYRGFAKITSYLEIKEK